ncbi:Heme-binding protein 2-like protein [Drosera capensis]
MEATSFTKLALIFCLFMGLWSEDSRVAAAPSACSRIECPSYDVVYSGKDYEIHRYDASHTTWISTSPIPGNSLTVSTALGFLPLFAYIQGANNRKQKIEMTAPVLTQVSPTSGSFLKSAYKVNFFLPKANQANPPTSTAVHPQKWTKTYAAVRQFSGFVMDNTVKDQVAALQASIKGSQWESAIQKSHGGNLTYAVAQYNSPFEFANRVNEIWFTFEQ